MHVSTSAAVKYHSITVITKFLIKGLIPKECYSVHVTLETKLRMKEMFPPAGYMIALDLVTQGRNNTMRNFWASCNCFSKTET